MSQEEEGSSVTTSSNVLSTPGVELAPGILAAIQRAVDNSFAARARLPSSSTSVPSVEFSAASIGLQANALLSAGTSTVYSSQGGAVGGKSPAVPAFMNTFTTNSLPSAMAASVSSSSLTSPPVAVASSGGSAVMPSQLYQPFVVGPGHSPIPAKLVGQILSNKFIDLNELLPANLSPITESEPQLMLDGRLVLTSQPKKPKRRFEDIVSWTEAFSIFSLVLTSYFPQRWRDLLQYKLLIIRTYRLFSGKAWLSYDLAFREHAAASHITDWSQINVQLYNFHTAGSQARLSSPICISWNRGRCSALYSPCRYTHRCSKCSGSHKEVECQEGYQPSSKRRGQSVSPGKSRDKYRKS